MTKYDEFCFRKAKQYPGKFDITDLHQRFVLAFNNGQRIEVAFRDATGKEYARKRGRVGVTTGWKPAFMLLLTRRSLGSSWLLGANDTVEHVIAPR